MKNIKFIIIVALGAILLVTIVLFVVNNKNTLKHSEIVKVTSTTNNTITSTNSPFTLSELTSITNYTFSSVDNSVAFNGSVI